MRDVSTDEGTIFAQFFAAASCFLLLLVALKLGGRRVLRTRQLAGL
jgi:hypothetical protein